MRMIWQFYIAIEPKVNYSYMATYTRLDFSVQLIWLDIVFGATAFQEF